MPWNTALIFAGAAVVPGLAIAELMVAFSAGESLAIAADSPRSFAIYLPQHVSVQRIIKIVSPEGDFLSSNIIPCHRRKVGARPRQPNTHATRGHNLVPVGARIGTEYPLLMLTAETPRLADSSGLTTPSFPAMG